MSESNSLRFGVSLRKALLSISVLALSLLFLESRASAQHGGGGRQSPGGMGGGQHPGGAAGDPNPFGRPANGYPPGPNLNNPPPPGSSPDNEAGPGSTMHGGLQLGPPGRWWNDDRFARGLGLDRGQQHRMDDIFKANKGDLVRLFKGLRHEESQLEKVSRARVLDEAQIDAQIDRVMQARGELEKANAHMLLEIRKQMTPEQTARLDDHRPTPPADAN